MKLVVTGATGFFGGVRTIVVTGFFCNGLSSSRNGSRVFCQASGCVTDVRTAAMISLFSASLRTW